MRRSRFLLNAACGASVTLALIAGGAAITANAVPAAGQAVPSGAAVSGVGQALPGLPVPVGAGNGLTANVTPSTGNVLLRASVGVAWDSSIRGVDRYDLGSGATWDAPFVTLGGGVFVYLPGLGVFAANPEAPSGLEGYAGGDRFTSFIEAPGLLPARDGVPEQHYLFTLQHAETGAVDYFNVNGHVIATIGADGSRTDRRYSDDVSNRLAALIDEGGAVVTVEYLPGEVQLRAEGRATTRLVQHRGQIVEIVTPWGGRSVLTRNGMAIQGVTSEARTGTTKVQFTWDSAKPERVTQVTRNGVVVYEGD